MRYHHVLARLGGIHLIALDACSARGGGDFSSRKSPTSVKEPPWASLGICERRH